MVCRFALTALPILGVSLGFFSTPALATTVHVRKGSFDGTGTTAGAFASVGRLAIDQSTGDLYALDKGRGVLDKFDEAGNPTNFAALGASSIGIEGLGYSPDLAVDNSGNVSTEGNIYVLSDGSGEVNGFEPDGTRLTGSFPIPGVSSPCGVAVDSHGDIWVSEENEDAVKEYSPAGVSTGVSISTAGQGPPCQIAFDSSDNLYVSIVFQGVRGVVKYDASHNYEFAYVVDSTESGAVAVDPADGHVYAKHASVFGGGPRDVTEWEVSGLSALQVSDTGGAFLAEDETGGVAVGGPSDDLYITDGLGKVDILGPGEPPPAPTIKAVSVSNVRSDLASLNATINPNSAETHYHFEYGTGVCSATPDPCTSEPNPDVDIGFGESDVPVSLMLHGLAQNTIYHWRVVAENQTGTTVIEKTFRTYSTGNLTDICSNAHVRQQTSAAQLPDCRAYELVSAANTGGYDVESNLVGGQTPFGGYPQASGPSRVLYAIHYGGIAGVGDPTNKGPDPYLATRGEQGWSTSYVGIPASGTPSKLPFASTLLEADPSLDTFAFGGEEICNPCFKDGSSGTPIHLPNGNLVQGMAGPENPGPTAKPDGYIAKHFSPDGSHFVFGSTSKFAEGGNSDGVVSIYDRDLKTGETHVVSDSPGGTPLPCLQTAGEGECHAPNDSNGIAELAVSKDGSRILVAQKVSEDVEGNVYWHLYMDINDNAKTIDLTPAVTKGVLFDGMTEDGSKVFFSSEEHLTHQDEHHSGADIYEAEVSGSGATLTLISKGEKEENGQPGDTAACTPEFNWNTVSGGPNCSAVAIAGGGGVASGDGTIYFLSPELLNGPSNGTANQPNLYVVRPGSTPHYVTTLETENLAVFEAVTNNGTFIYGDFQVSPSGDFAAFISALPLLPTVDNAGFTQVYRYDASTETLNCASCNPTGAIDEGEGTLSELGLGLTNDGRVFFDSTEALAARDQDEKTDVYEWEARGSVEAKGGYECQIANGCVGLISTGTSRFDSKLLGVSAAGTDALFFTRDVLVPQDENGTLTKIYDARELGGFPYIPPPVPCKASDECHGPSSPTPSAPSFGTITGSGGNYSAPSTKTRCKTGFVRKHGKCVKKVRHERHKGKHKHRANKHRKGSVRS